MSDVVALSEELQARERSALGAAHLRQCTVVAVSTTAPTCSIYLGADTSVQVDGVAYLASDVPLVNDVVWVLQNGSDLLVLGRQLSLYTETRRFQNDKSGSSTTSSTTYADLADGAGPTISNVFLVAGQACSVRVQSRCKNSAGGAGHSAFMSFAVSGAETNAATDADALEALETAERTLTAHAVYTPVVTGLHTFTAKYKTTNGLDTASYTRRRIIVER